MSLEEKMKGSFLSPYKIVKPYMNKQMPQTVEVHIAYQCNFNCEWCIDKHHMETGTNQDRKSMLTEEGVKEIIRFCDQMSVNGIIISGGGEPALTKSTDLLVKLANENNIGIGMFTNGSIMPEETMKTYIDNLTFLRFSVDDFDADYYSKTKGVPKQIYYTVLENIERCTKYKKESKNDKCRIGIDFVIKPDNIPRLVDMYFQSIELGVDYIEFCDCVIPGYEFTESTRKKIEEKLTAILYFKKVRWDKIDVVYEPIRKENTTLCKDCLVKDYIVEVGADGLVRPCPFLSRRDDLAYGNIYKDRMFDIWKNRPKKLDTDLLYENCRFIKQNEILKGLDYITHGDMI